MPHLRTVFASLIALLITAGVVSAGEFGTREQAKAMLERTVAVLKADKNSALNLFTSGHGGFKIAICASSAEDQMEC